MLLRFCDCGDVGRLLLDAATERYPAVVLGATTAQRLGISQRTLRYKLARLREAGIDVPAA